MRQIPGLQAAWSAGVTAKGAPSTVGASIAAGGDTTAAVRVGLTGATARRGAVRLTADRGAAATRGRARRVRRPRVAARRVARALRAVRCAAAGRLGLRSGFAGCAADLRLARGAAFFAVL